MKKIFLYTAVAMFSLSSCRTDEAVKNTEPSDIAVQNSYDDQAIEKFMKENYLDTRGNIKPFSSTDASDDNYPSLFSLPHQTLPSGVIYLVRDGAQPVPGTTIGDTDVIRIMGKALGYVATNTDNVVALTAPAALANTIQGSGVPDVDPAYYYVKNAVLTSSGKTRSYYEIEGFQEALRKFKAFDIADSESYNLQGVIIVPSRAAFARDDHYHYTGISWRNRTIVYNFQVYKSTPRTADQL